MDPKPEWPPENALQQARLKYGLMLATGQLRCEATPQVAATFWRKLTHHMATCDLNVVDHDGARALCRFMYTEYGFARPTKYDWGPSVHYRETASALWDRLKQHQEGARGGRPKALGGWPSSVNVTEMRMVWCSLVCALPPVDK